VPQVSNDEFITALKLRKYKSGTYDEFDSRAWSIFNDELKAANYRSTLIKELDCQVNSLIKSQNFETIIEKSFAKNLEEFKST
jgi:hypothetical protein